MAKQDRIDFRVDPHLKAQFAEAAEAAGMSLSTFIIAAAREQAVRLRQRQQAVVLSDRDRDLFLNALDRPARPIPESVRKAKERHDQLIEKD